MSRPAIEVSHLYKRYRKHVAVQDVSFTVELGEIFGIVGPNGAGKTTTVECIAGLRAPDSGMVRVLGLDPQRDRSALTQRVGVQLQQSQLPDKITVWEVLNLYRSFYRTPANASRLLADMGLANQRNTAFGKLSGGQKQRLSIALALIGNPEVALLDELTTGLDPQARRDTWQMIEQIRARGVTILLVTHLMEEAEQLCDRLAVIDTGRVVALDSPGRLVALAASEQRIRFRPSAPLADHLLTTLPEVRTVQRKGAQVLATGSGDLVHAVSSLLARNGIEAFELRVEETTLDDAFITLTGRPMNGEDKEQAS
jgi:ABC-2 type transport system ATP-binding protein